MAIIDGYSSQALDLSSNISKPKKLSNPPFDTWGSVGAFVGGAALACVGNKCLVYDAFNDDWKDLGLRMREERQAAAAVMVQEDKVRKK
jgi:hypothetical protein